MLDAQPDPHILMHAVRADGGLEDFECIEANTAALSELRIPAEALTGIRLSQLYPQELAAAMHPLCTRTLETGEITRADGCPAGEPTRYYDVCAMKMGDSVCLSWCDVTDQTVMTRRLAESESRFRSAMNASLDWQIFLKAVRDQEHRIVDLRVVEANARAAARLGRSYEQLIGQGIREMLGTQTNPEWWRRVIHVIDTGEPWVSPLVPAVAVKTEPDHWFAESVVKFDDGVFFSWRDITDEHNAIRAEIEDINYQYRLMVDNSADVVFLTTRGIVKWVSPSASDVLGWTPDELTGRPTEQLWHPDDRETAVALRDATYSGRTGKGTFRWLRKDGEYVWLEARMRPVKERDGGMGAVGVLRDVTERIEAQDEIARVMRHDTLTGLSTRSVLSEKMQAVLDDKQTEDTPAAVLCVNVDRLSDVNAAYGHATGDIALSTVASRVVDVVGDSGTVSRGASVELFTLLPAADISATQTIAEKIRRAAKEPIRTGKHELALTVSIGIAVSHPGATAEHLLQAATLAMRKAKSQGHDDVAFSEPAMGQEAQRRVAVMERARVALSERRFHPWYMPIVDLGTGHVEGYEALARWQADGTEWIEPTSFLPVMESSALVCELDLEILDQALQTLALQPPEQFMSVNISARTLATSDYTTRILEMIKHSGVDARRLHLEVTETTLLGLSQKVVSAMRRIAGTGAAWYVDDFGTGYSSISHLRDLPLSGLKLDKSFTNGVSRGDVKCLRLSQALAGLSRGLGLDTVAEGVEHDEEAQVLATQGWHRGQGWLFGRAAPEVLAEA